MELKIESRGLEMEDRWREEIEQRATDLNSGHDDLTHARVVVSRNKTHITEAVIVVNVPPRHTFTARKEERTVEEAYRAAFTAVETELKKFRDKRAAH